MSPDYSNPYEIKPIEEEFPKLLKPIHSFRHIDATPTPDYAIRILKAYRDEGNFRWSSTSDGTGTGKLVKELNKLQDQRNKLLDTAIKILEKSLSGKE